MRKRAYYLLMKRLSTLALMAVLVALPVCAQRVASRSGFSGHAAQSSHGGFSAPSRFAGTPRAATGRSFTTGPRSFTTPRGFQNPRARGFNPRPPYTGDNRHRRPYRSPYWGAGSYGAPGWGMPYFLAYPDLGGDDQSETPLNYADEGYGEQPEDQEEPAPRIPYQGAFDLPHPSATADSENAVTLVFKDGRPSEQIYNYILTQTTLYVGDRYHREIPTDQLDLVATAKVNHDAGADFHLPDSAR